MLSLGLCACAGAITITSVTNVPSTNTLRVSFEGGLQSKWQPGWFTILPYARKRLAHAHKAAKTSKWLNLPTWLSTS